MSEFRMNPDKLDTILATEEELLPSAGFLASVMEQVREEAVAPAPIPFPWKRLLPGILLTCGLLVWFLIRSADAGITLLDRAETTSLQIPAAPMQSLQSAGWIVLALAISLLCMLLATRLTRRSGLF